MIGVYLLSFVFLSIIHDNLSALAFIKHDKIGIWSSGNSIADVREP